ncbi:dienelactone hydrolase [Clavibacter michiganensis]|uniref:alpha/beta hydrolase n=1 Tax=Clavibacter michiganensis TaxID=28447 RepID=UPI0019586C8C|nr:dienelactone hydrolase family protein [Clavibacter michiganensis]MBM7412501.1 dienelactone hydrolase [Clavibacter michiganensis]
MSVTRSAFRTRPVAVAALATLALLGVPTAAQAATPAHAATADSASAHHHAAYPLRQYTIPAVDGSGFGDATLYAPQDTGKKALGAIVVAPGLKGTRSDLEWLAKDLAGEGFIVLNMNTLGSYDLPNQRSYEMLAAAKYLATASPVKDQVDPADIGVVGYSLAGGGALQAAVEQHGLKAAVALMPYDFPAGTTDPYHPTQSPTYPTITTPTLVITGQADTTAPASFMGKPAYDSIPASTPKQYLELRGADHYAARAKTDGTVRDAVTNFLKAYLDGNSAYKKYVCPAQPVSAAISDSASSCPR